MGAKNITFITFFFLSLLALSFMLGSTITGRVVQSMYCIDGECSQFCRFNNDCTEEDNVCCSAGNFGICEKSSFCEKEYEFHPEANIEDISVLDKPAPINRNISIVLCSLILVILIIGIVYLIDRRKWLL